MVRQGLRCALEVHPNIEVVGVCVAKVQPTVVVMDINMPRMDGIEATRLIKARHPTIAVVGMSGERKDYTLYSMQKAGASQVVLKEHGAVVLHDAIQWAVAAIQPVSILETASSNQALTKELANDEPTESQQTGQQEP